ncbi:MAG: diguanylate cyclase [Tepidimonas ignava]
MDTVAAWAVCLSGAGRAGARALVLVGVAVLLGLLVLATPARAGVALQTPTVDVAMLQGGSMWLRPLARTLREDAVPRPPPTPLALLQTDLPWQPVRDLEPIFGFGFDRQAWWVHVALRHDGPAPLELVLEAAEPLIDDIRVWVFDRGRGTWVAQAHQGDRVVGAVRALEHRHLALPLTLQPGQQVDLLVRVFAVDGEHDPLPLRLWRAAAFFSHAQLEAWMYGAYYGALGVLLLYNLLLWAGTRESPFGLYALYLGSFLLWNLTYRGYALLYLWPDAVTWNQIALVGFSAAIYATMALFAWTLLDLPRRTPWLARLQAVLALAALAHAVWIALDPQAATFATLDLVGLAMFGVLLLAALRVAWQGERVAWIYLAAQGSLLAGAGVYYAIKLEWLAPGPLALQALNLGSAGEFLLLALALAYRINQLKAQRDLAQGRLMETLHQMNERLEREVAERTEQLTQANQALTKLATHDPLTGLYNRHTLLERLTEELARARRHPQPLGLLMLDLDHFKPLNDRGGHAYGDHVLRQLGVLLHPPLLRTTDRAFRVGGEEFLVLAPDTDADGLQTLAERVRSAVHAQGWPHPDASIGWVTVSVGATLSRPDDTPETIFARADQALYEAKRLGRNRVAYA